MGTSMTIPVNAERNRLDLKARVLTSYARQVSSQYFRPDGRRYSQNRRPVSQNSRILIKSNTVKKQKPTVDKQNDEIDKTPVFTNSFSKNYIELEEVSKVNKNSSIEKQLEKQNKMVNKEPIQQEDNYFLTREKQSSKISQMSKRKISNDGTGQELKLSLNSNIKLKNEEFYMNFSPVLRQNMVEVQEAFQESQRNRSKSKERANNLILKMIKEDPKPGSLLQKYLPKSKLQKKKGFGQILTSSVRTPIKKYGQKSQYFEEPNKEKESGKRFEKYYLNWKKKEKSRRKSLSKSNSKPLLKRSDKVDYYQIQKKKPVASNEEQVSNKGKMKLSQLIKVKKDSRNQKLNESHKTTKQSVKSLASWRSQKRLKLIHF